MAYFGAHSRTATAFGWVLSFEDVRPLYGVLLAVPLLFWWLRGSAAPLARSRAIVSAILRLALAALVAAALAGPAIRVPSRAACAVVALDVSDSMDEASIQDGIRLFRELEERALPGDQVRLVAFAEQAQESKSTDTLSPSALRAKVGRGVSDLMQGLFLARSLASGDCAGRVVIFSDGRETRGQVMQSWPPSEESAPEDGSRKTLFWARAEPKTVPDVAVLELDVPRDARVGEPFRFQVHLASSEARRVRLRVSRGVPGEVPMEREVDVPVAGLTESFEATLAREGPATLWAEVEPGGIDAFAENNRSERRVMALGPPRVLVVDGEPDSARELGQALSAQKFAVTLAGPYGVPRTEAELGEFSSVILSDLKRSELGSDSEVRLINYVRKGGALLFAGGERSFGAGGFEGSPLESILALKIVGEDERERASVAMALVIDRRSAAGNGQASLSQHAFNLRAVRLV
jgi:Ca-activated chloride channel homolog